ncbi:hypothetical protein PHISP_07272 [Aspergillus sp. HF37]|nr:hypothetical protein PHISP_07272 [Aspergillus sp. HF37]
MAKGQAISTPSHQSAKFQVEDLNFDLDRGHCCCVQARCSGVRVSIAISNAPMTCAGLGVVASGSRVLVNSPLESDIPATASVSQHHCAISLSIPSVHSPQSTSSTLYHILTINQIARFLHETIHDHLLTPTLLPNLLRAARAGLVPGNGRQTPTPAPLQGLGQGTGIRALVAAAAPHATDQRQQESPAPAPATAPTTPAGGGVPSNATATGASSLPSSSDEIDPTRTRRGCAVRILRVLPRQVTRSLLGRSGVPVSVPDGVVVGGGGGDSTTPTTSTSNNSADNPRSKEEPSIPEEDLAYLETIESDILALFADEYCNKHLVFAIIELVLVRLLPELRERSVGELLEDRGLR